MIILKLFCMILRWRVAHITTDRHHWRNLVTAILKLFVTGRRDGDYQLVRMVCVHRIT